MSHYTTPQSVLFPDLFSKPLFAQFDRPHSSSDGGAILLKAADRRLGLTERLMGALPEHRQAGKVRHELGDLLSQRVFSIASGYPDCNDIPRMSEDPILKLLVFGETETGRTFGSQATLSRFENGLRRSDLYRLGEALADAVIERHRDRLRGRAKRITIDLDPTDTPTYGEQQLTFFNGHYDSWCYLPQIGFLTFDEEPEQYAFTALLRSGKAAASLGAVGLLRRTIEKLRQAFPKARLRVRLDGGFASPQMFEFLEEQEVEYLVAMAENSVLKRKAARLMRRAKRSFRTTGKTEPHYGSVRYKAKTWERRRRVIVKAEVVQLPGRESRENARFVVTNMAHDPQEIYEVDYCGRGEIENRIRELKNLRIDRMSCTRFWANQFRALLTVAAFALMQEIRSRAARTALGRAQVWTLRERLFKLGAHAVSSVRRIVLHFPQNCPVTEAWCAIARSFATAPG